MHLSHLPVQAPVSFCAFCEGRGGAIPSRELVVKDFKRQFKRLENQVSEMAEVRAITLNCDYPGSILGTNDEGRETAPSSTHVPSTNGQ